MKKNIPVVSQQLVLTMAIIREKNKLDDLNRTEAKLRRKFNLLKFAVS